MYKIYSIFIISLLAVIYFMAGKKSPDPSALKEPSNVLPLTFISLGDSCIKPSKIEIESWVSEGTLLSGSIAFSAELRGNQVFMCSIKIPAQKTTLPINDNCVYPIKFKEIDPLKCIYEPEPVVHKLKTKTAGSAETTDERCGPGKRGKMYRFVYEICTTDGEIPNEKSPEFCNLQNISIQYRSEFEIFRFCYDEHDKNVIHTEHKILSPGLLTHRKLKQEREKSYEMMIDNLNYFGLDLQILKSKHAQFENQNEKKEDIFHQIPHSNAPISNEKFQFKHQNFVPHDDFAFALWRKPTYHYFNYKPMRKDLIKLWDYIGERIRYSAVRLNREYYIHTGAYEKAIDQENPNISTRRSLEMPDIWLKIIYHFDSGSKTKDIPSKTQAIAIIMDVNFDNDTETETWFDEKCVENLCSNAFAMRFPVARKSIRCCSMARNQILIESDVKVDEDLDLDFLYEDEI